MKIGKRENKQLKKRLESIFEGILEDAETQLMESIADEIMGYVDDDEDDAMEICSIYLEDTIKSVYAKRSV